jgi:hypothetical protein
MPTPRPRNTEHRISAVLETPEGAPRADVAKFTNGDLA